MKRMFLIVGVFLLVFTLMFPSDTWQGSAASDFFIQNSFYERVGEYYFQCLNYELADNFFLSELKSSIDSYRNADFSKKGSLKTFYERVEALYNLSLNASSNVSSRYALIKLNEILILHSDIKTMGENIIGMSDGPTSIYLTDTKTQQPASPVFKYEAMQPDQVYAEIGIIKEKSRGFKILKQEKNLFYVLVSAGEKSTGGYSLNLEDITFKDSTVTIKIKETSPARGKPVTQAFSYPQLVLKFYFDYSAVKNILVTINNVELSNL